MTDKAAGLRPSRATPPVPAGPVRACLCAPPVSGGGERPFWTHTMLLGRRGSWDGARLLSHLDRPRRKAWSRLQTPCPPRSALGPGGRTCCSSGPPSPAAPTAPPAWHPCPAGWSPAAAAASPAAEQSGCLRTHPRPRVPAASQDGGPQQTTGRGTWKLPQPHPNDQHDTEGARCGHDDGASDRDKPLSKQGAPEVQDTPPLAEKHPWGGGGLGRHTLWCQNTAFCTQQKLPWGWAPGC